MSRSGNTVFTYSFWRWGLAGIALASPLFVISLISNGFDYEITNIDKPILAFVALMMMAGVIYLLVILGFKQDVFSKRLLVWVILLGLLVRISMSASTPILEDDYYRYLWDGGVVAKGFNPYQYAPRDILVGGNIDLPHHLTELALQAKPILERINYPRLRTVYPPHFSRCLCPRTHDRPLEYDGLAHGLAPTGSGNALSSFQSAPKPKPSPARAGDLLVESASDQGDL